MADGKVLRTVGRESLGWRKEKEEGIKKDKHDPAGSKWKEEEGNNHGGPSEETVARDQPSGDVQKGLDKGRQN